MTECNQEEKVEKVEKVEKKVHFRGVLSRADHQLVREAAARRGFTVKFFIEQTVIAQAKRVLAEPRPVETGEQS
jgi:uncharacterized protein (DUF1778 family)